MTTTRREVLGIALVGLLPTTAATAASSQLERDQRERSIREHDIAIRLQDNTPSSFAQEYEACALAAAGYAGVTT